MLGLPIEDNSSINRYLQNKRLVTSVAVFFAAIFIFFVSNGFNYVKIYLTSTDKPELCPVYDKVVPKSFLEDNSTVSKILFDENFKLQSVEKLSGAIQVDTQIFDNLPPVDEAPEEWVQFKDFHAYLNKTFPTVYEKLEVETVNTYGLVFTWKGTEDLKPIILMAHQDVVPVQKSTIDKWTYPPLSGHYDGKFVYGRGAFDCKNVLIAIMETLELFIEQGFQPKRSIIAAFGFDEESSGYHGAAHIAQHLEKQYGKDSIYAIIDEGSGLMVDPITKKIVATPATGEKGYIDVGVSLTTPGGHSSVPPDHTSIGIMSELIYIIEKDQFSPILSKKNPYLANLQCAAVHGEDAPSFLRKAILRAGFDKFANKYVVDYILKDPLSKYLIQTSQAADIIGGGEKANALPENVDLLVNHRISIDSSIEEVQDHFTSRVIEVAKRHGLGVKAFGKQVLKGDGKLGEFELTENDSLLIAPLTPINNVQWEYLSGTIRHVFEDLVFPNITYPILTVPSLLTGNTDTKYYWNLTKNIYRFSPLFGMELEANIHSVDEKLDFEYHLQLLAFFYEYIQNVDTAKAG